MQCIMGNVVKEGIHGNYDQFRYINIIFVIMEHI